MYTILTSVAVIASNLLKFIFTKVHTVRLMNLKHWNHSHYTWLDLLTESALSRAQKKQTNKQNKPTKMQNTSSQIISLTGNSLNYLCFLR